MQLPRMLCCGASNVWLRHRIQKTDGDKSGAKMIFPGLPKDEDIDNVIAHLKQFGAVGKKS